MLKNKEDVINNMFDFIDITDEEKTAGRQVLFRQFLNRIPELKKAIEEYYLMCDDKEYTSKLDKVCRMLSCVWIVESMLKRVPISQLIYNQQVFNCYLIQAFTIALKYLNDESIWNNDFYPFFAKNYKQQEWNNTVRPAKTEFFRVMCGYERFLLPYMPGSYTIDNLVAIGKGAISEKESRWLTFLVENCNLTLDNAVGNFKELCGAIGVPTEDDIITKLADFFLEKAGLKEAVDKLGISLELKQRYINNLIEQACDGVKINKETIYGLLGLNSHFCQFDHSDSTVFKIAILKTFMESCSDPAKKATIAQACFEVQKAHFSQDRAKEGFWFVNEKSKLQHSLFSRKTSVSKPPKEPEVYKQRAMIINPWCVE